MSTTSLEPDPSADARNRAWRTLAQGLLVDVAIAVVVGAGTAIAGETIAWTAPFWLGVAGLTVRSAATAAVSYFARRVLPPAVP